MNRIRSGAVAAAMLVFVLGIPAAALSASSSPAKNQITMNFQNVEIPVLARFISEITGKNFIIDQSVRGRVTIISPSKVTPEQAYSMFQSVLQIKGFTTVKAGQVIKIVPSRDMRSSAALVESQRSFRDSGDEFVTRMLRLQNVDVSSLVNVVQAMVSRDGLVAAYPQDNTLIITDNAFNVRRLTRIVERLDSRGVHQDTRVIPLRLAFAGDLAPKIEDIMKARTSKHRAQRRGRRGVVAPAAEGPRGAFKIVPDERTNSLIVLAAPLVMRQIVSLVKQLDIRPPNATTRIHVYRLQNAQALEIVGVLDGLLNGGSSPTSLSPRTGRLSLGRGSANGFYNGNNFGAGFGGVGGGSGYGGLAGSAFGSSGFSSQGVPSTRSRGGRSSGRERARARSTGTSANSTEFTNPVSVTGDPATNSLLVSASPQDWHTLKQVIQKLDVPRVQVFVQAIIVEVSADHSRNLGVNFSAGTGFSSSVLGVGSLNFGQLQTALGNPLGLSGLGLGLASGSTCSVPVAVASAVASGATGGAGSLTVPCDLALITALETDRHTNVLSAPTLLTADNSEAMIIIGQNLPFLGSSAANAGLPGQIFNSVQRQNVGITLDLIPQVSEGDYVRIDLYQEVSNVLGSTINDPLGPTTTIRSASTTVLVQNHRTAVIGGLLSSMDERADQGVPFISNIPVLGNLFSGTGRKKNKDNLLVFLTPHIVRTPRDLRSLALDQREKFVHSLGRKEMHDMPLSQVRQVYKPNFSVAVPPSAGPVPGLSGTASPQYPPESAEPSDSRGGETPLNTEEIGPRAAKLKGATKSRSDRASAAGTADKLTATASAAAASATATGTSALNAAKAAVNPLP